jgi:outer membrane protein OmpA-like peptidoglycan-associated protein
MKTRILAIIFIFGFASSLSAAVLKWDMRENESIEIIKTARINYYVNARLNRVYDERNIIDISSAGKEGTANAVNGIFTIYEKNADESVFRQREKYPVDFLIEPSGKFIVEKKDYMPNLRHIPTFPEGDVKINDTWKAEGELVIDNFSRPFKLVFPVEYKLSQFVKQKGLDIAVIDYEYSINMDLQGDAVPSDFPVKIAGHNKGVIYWDVSNNRPSDMRDLYRIAFIFRGQNRSYNSAEFQMAIETVNNVFPDVKEDEKEKDIEDMKKELPQGVDVDSEERGVVVTMGDLLFDFDSYRIREDTREKLEKIAEIIKKKYPDREIIIEGHTDNIGKKSYNNKLSEKRAKSVSEVLKPKVGHDKFSFKGYGQDKPVADNSTSEGRSKNRRVEIIIKLN